MKNAIATFLSVTIIFNSATFAAGDRGPVKATMEQALKAREEIRRELDLAESALSNKLIQEQKNPEISEMEMSFYTARIFAFAAVATATAGFFAVASLSFDAEKVLQVGEHGRNLGAELADLKENAFKFRSDLAKSSQQINYLIQSVQTNSFVDSRSFEHMRSPMDRGFYSLQDTIRKISSSPVLDSKLRAEMETQLLNAKKVWNLSYELGDLYKKDKIAAAEALRSLLKEQKTVHIKLLRTITPAARALGKKANIITQINTKTTIGSVLGLMATIGYGMWALGNKSDDKKIYEGLMTLNSAQLKSKVLSLLSADLENEAHILELMNQELKQLDLD